MPVRKPTKLLYLIAYVQLVAKKIEGSVIILRCVSENLYMA